MSPLVLTVQSLFSLLNLLIFRLTQVSIRLTYTQQSGNFSGTVDILFYQDFLFYNCRRVGRLKTPHRSALASLALELSSSAKGKSRSRTAPYLFKSYLPSFLLSIHSLYATIADKFCGTNCFIYSRKLI